MPDTIVTDQRWEQVKHLVSRERIPSVSYPEKIIRRGVAAAIWIQDNSSSWEQLPGEYGDRHTMYSVISALSSAGVLRTVITAVREIAQQETESDREPPAASPERQEETELPPAEPAEPRPQETPQERVPTTDEPPSPTPPDPEDATAATPDETQLPTPLQTAQETNAPETEDESSPVSPEDETDEHELPPSTYDRPIGPFPRIPDPDLALIRHLEHWINAHYYDAYVSAHPEKTSHYFYHHFRPVLDLMFEWYCANNPDADEPRPRLIDTNEDYATLEGQDLLNAIIRAASWIRDDVSEFYSSITELLAMATHGQKIPYRHYERLPTPAPYPPDSQPPQSETRNIHEPLTVEDPPHPTTQPRQPESPPTRRTSPTAQPAPQRPTRQRTYGPPVSHNEVVNLAAEYASQRDGIIVPREFAQYLTDGPLAHRTLRQNLGTVRNIIGQATHGGRFTNLGNGRWRVRETS